MSNSALSHGYLVCRVCGEVQALQRDGEACQFCGHKVHARNPHSLAYSWCFLLASAAMLLPANLLPIMKVTSLGSEVPATIIGGVITLFEQGASGIALVVFVASVVIPVGKVIALLLLLIALQRGWLVNQQQQMSMYRMVEWIGRWSMLDIFVVAVLAALVKLGQLATIEGGPGATAFALAVVFTILAAHHFDTRLIWDSDNQEQSTDDTETTPS